jgi:hypothetical protein
MKCVFLFSLQLSLEKFLVLVKIKRDIVVNVKNVSTQSTLYSCRI